MKTMEELDLSEKSIVVARTQWEFDMDKVWRDNDLATMRQELCRRNIECCLNVIRTQNATTKTGVHIKDTTRDLAETKLVMFLNQLVVK